MSYDGLWRNTKIVETTSGSVTSTKQFVGTAKQRLEERGAGGSVTSLFFKFGQTITGSSYFYTRNHIATVVELSDNAGAIVGQFEYDPYGRTSRVSGTLDSTYLFAAYYSHSRSLLYLSVFRPYNPAEGRFLSRDILEEQDGSNLYNYVHSSPVNAIDSEGTFVLLLLGGLASGEGGAMAAAAAAGALAAGGLLMTGMSNMSGSGSGAGKKIGFDCTPDPDCDPPFLNGKLKDATACHAWCEGCKNVFKRNLCRLQCDWHNWPH